MSRNNWIDRIVIGTLIVAGWGCAPSREPNVVIVVVDTLRADHLSAYGYSRSTSPNLDEFASRGALFERFFSHSAVTRPSVATLLTSQYLSGHGIATQGGDVLPKALQTLPEVLSARGYTCRGFVTNPQLHPDLGFDQGFSSYTTFFTSDLNPRNLQPQDLVEKAHAAEVFDVVQRSLQDGITEPYCLYIHLMDPHGPYQPAPAHAARFIDPSYAGPVTGSIHDFGRIAFAAGNAGPDLQRFIDLYDGEIFGFDEALGSFLRWFEETRWADETHFILTSDHGEEFKEHGGTGHSIKLYDETVHIPLIWVGPGVEASARIESLAGLVDIYPTLLGMLDLPADEFDVQGRDLSGLLRGGSPSWTEPRTIFLEGPGKGSEMRGGVAIPRVNRGVRTTTHKALVDGSVFMEPGWREIRLFDLRSDPGETHALTVGPQTPESELGPLENLRTLYDQELERVLADGTPELRETRDLSPEQIQRLRSLGYLD